MTDRWWMFETLDVAKPRIQNVTISAAEPTYEPLELALVKTYLKVDTSADDTLIDVLIMAARKQIENELGGYLIVKRSVTQKQTGGLETIDLLRQPVNSITSVTFYENFDSAGEVVASSKYRFSDGKLYHTDGYWKAGRESDGYVIVYNAGVQDDTGQSAENSSKALRTAMLRYIAYMYENREQFAGSVNEGNFSIQYDQKIKTEINLLLMPYHTGKGLI